MPEPTKARPRTSLSGWDVLLSVASATAWVAIVRPGEIDLPFFWDEADVYVPGSVWLAAHPLLLVAACGALFTLTPPVWRRPLPRLAWAPISVSVMLRALAMRAPTEPDAEEQTFAYADVIATHRAAFAGIEHPEPRVLTTWPMTIELRHAYLGYVEHDVYALNVRYLDDHRGAALTHALVNTASPHAERLRVEAGRRGMRLLHTHRVGVAPALEVWGP